MSARSPSESPQCAFYAHIRMYMRIKCAYSHPPSTDNAYVCNCAACLPLSHRLPAPTTSCVVSPRATTSSSSRLITSSSRHHQATTTSCLTDTTIRWDLPCRTGRTTTNSPLRRPQYWVPRNATRRRDARSQSPSRGRSLNPGAPEPPRRQRSPRGRSPPPSDEESDEEPHDEDTDDVEDRVFANSASRSFFRKLIKHLKSTQTDKWSIRYVSFFAMSVS